jgi:hypothetical protein
VPEISTSTVPTPDRRVAAGSDRRKHPRSGRRSTDPHVDWRRLAWLFGAYAAYLSIRSLPANVRKLFGRRTPTGG